MKLEKGLMSNVPEVQLPDGGSKHPYDGPVWYLCLRDGRTLRLAEVYEGEFTVERCDLQLDQGGIDSRMQSGGSA